MNIELDGGSFASTLLFSPYIPPLCPFSYLFALLINLFGTTRKIYYIEAPYAVEYATPLDARLHSAMVPYYQSRVILSRGSPGPAVWHERLLAQVVVDMNRTVGLRGQVGAMGTIRRRASI